MEWKRISSTENTDSNSESERVTSEESSAVSPKDSEPSLTRVARPVKSVETQPARSESALRRVSPTATPSRKSSDVLPWYKRRKTHYIIGSVFGVLAVIAVLGGLTAWWLYGQVQVLQAEARDTAATGRLVYASFKAQNLPEAKMHLESVQSKIVSIQDKYQRMGWLGSVPFASAYYKDGVHGLAAAAHGAEAGHKLIEAVEPHADLLGFEGEGTFAGTTEDRIGMVLETLNTIAPQLDAIEGDVSAMQAELIQIDAERYPEQFRGYPLRQYLLQAQSGAETAKIALTEARPALEQLPKIAGSETRRKYLVIFQNDNELRPTGGFMTAYAVIYVENGKVTQEKSDDIYEMDKKFTRKPPIPAELGRYLTTETRWNLRDMNIDPSFKASMDTFYEYYQLVPGEPKDIDGIIAVDTVMLEKILEVIGPVELPGYGTFTTETVPQCDCPQIIYALSEIIDRPTPYIREDRKGILAPLMQGIIAKTYATPRQSWPLLAQIAWEGTQSRHAQFYFFDETEQQAAELIGVAGVIPDMKTPGDYLTVIDANLGGAKSNLFTETEGVVTVESVADGKVTKEVELTYRNTHAGSNCNLEAGLLCLNATMNMWSRWYVPKGVEIIEAAGMREAPEVDTTHEGYDIVEGVLVVTPMGQTKVRIKYTVPYSGVEGTDYVLNMQKQGGTDPFPYVVTTPYGEQEVLLDKDVTVRFE